MLHPADETLDARNDSLIDARYDALARGVRAQHQIRRFAKLCLQLLVFAALIGALFFRAPQVEGQSMVPTIADGTHVLINTLAYRFGRPIARGDVVAFEQGEGEDRKVLLKRVVGLPGDRVAFEDGRIEIDGAPLQEPYHPVLDRTNLRPVVVPQGSLFVVGDNRAESDDSRLFGPVAESVIVGKALLVVWPPGCVSQIH